MAINVKLQSPTREPLPEDEPYATANILAQKVRWWVEESVRCAETGNASSAQAILTSLVRPTIGLLYRLESALGWLFGAY